MNEVNYGSNKKTVILTGATGFIGCHCIKPLIDRGYRVHAVASKIPSAPVKDVQWHEADLLDLTSIPNLLRKTKATHLLHLAWYSEPGKYVNSDLNFSWFQSSLELVKQFTQTGGKRIAIAGSSFEYDWKYGYCSEIRTPLAFDSPYGSCKNALRILVEEYTKLHCISAVWPRIFFLYGPHEHPDRLVSSVMIALIRGDEAKCTHGRQIRDYMLVHDVADALVTLLDNDVEGPVNIGSSQPISVRQLVQTIGQLMQREDLLRFGAIPTRVNDLPLVVADVERLTSAVGWKPQYSLKEGLMLTADWWRAHMQ